MSIIDQLLLNAYSDLTTLTAYISQQQETALEATTGTVTQVGTTNAWTITSVEVAPNDHQAEFSLPVTDRNSLISYVSITTPAGNPAAVSVQAQESGGAYGTAFALDQLTNTVFNKIKVFGTAAFEFTVNVNAFWRYEWDFESELYRDNREFFHDGNPINGNVFGVYVDGSGHRTSGSDENAWMSAKTNNIHLTRLRIELTTQTNAQPRIGIWDSNSGVTSPFGVAGDPIVDVPLDDLFDTLWIRFRYDTATHASQRKSCFLKAKARCQHSQAGF